MADDGWEVFSTRKTKGQSSGGAKGKGVAPSGQDRSVKARGGFTNVNLNGRWEAAPCSNAVHQDNAVMNQSQQKRGYNATPGSANPVKAWHTSQDAGNGGVSNSLAKGNTNPSSVESSNSENKADWRSMLFPFEPSGEAARESIEKDKADGNVTETESEIEEMGSDDDFISSDEDEFNSDDSNMSHETKKKNKWLKSFFESLGNLTFEEMTDPQRQWHCPACAGGVGAIDWYRGLQPVLAHAQSIRTKRIKLHRCLSSLLNEELRRRGAGCSINEEKFGKWKGLGETNSDTEIVWPPMVIVQNTLLEKDDNEKWLGMGNKELMEYFKDFKAIKARHSYGPKGHRGISALIFEDSAIGYMEAERLHKEFHRKGRGRAAWEVPNPTLRQPGGQRILYGFYAKNEDIDTFNIHSKGQTRLKYDMKSYNEKVFEPMRQMDENNQKLHYLQTKVAKQEDYSRTLEKSFGEVNTKLRMKEKEIETIRQRTSEQHEQYIQEMDFLEKIYRKQIDDQKLHLDDREQELEKIHKDFNLQNMNRCHELEVNASNMLNDNGEKRGKKIEIDKEIKQREALVDISVKDSEQYEKEREELLMKHDRKRKEFKIKHLQEEADLEKQLEKERAALLDKYMKKGQDAGYVIV